MPFSKFFTRTAMLVFVLPLFNSGCIYTSCTRIEQTGSSAIANISKYDPLLPNTFLIVPDSILFSTTTGIDSLLNTLSNEGLLTYRLVDSGMRRRSLSGPGFQQQPGNAMFYKYSLDWNNGLEATHIKSGEVTEVRETKLFGKTYNAEFQFNARYQRAGVLSFSATKAAFFKQTCDSIFMEYAYEMNATEPLARMAGMPAFIKGDRKVSMPFPQ